MREPRIRFDFLVAVCALAISSLAAGASFWQARVMETQTNVLEQQLGAQVWPYVGTAMTIDDNTVTMTIENDGLGPAILRSASIIVDGKSRGDLIDVLHALLGPHIVARAKMTHDTKIGFDLSAPQPGSVLRSGQTTDLLRFTSKRFALPMEQAAGRVNFRICYCAVLPGKCWESDTASTRDPQPLDSCPNLPHDLLHAAVPDSALVRNF